MHKAGVICLLLFMPLAELALDSDVYHLIRNLIMRGVLIDSCQFSITIQKLTIKLESKDRK